jgi:hypothetical protein
VEIYDLTTASGSDSIYTIFVPSEYDTLADLGDKGRLNTSPLADYVIEFKRGQYYSIITCLKNDTMLSAAKSLAQLIDQKMEKTTHITPGPAKGFLPGNRVPVFDLHGSLVEMIPHQGPIKGPDKRHLVNGLLPGVYFIKLGGRDYSNTQKLLIIK